MFLALSGLVTLGVSCSSDDNSSDEVKEGQLAVTADKTEIKEGDSVKFTITLDGKADTSAELFIEDTQIYTPHKFDKAGKYNVVAKKKGAKTSAPVTITVGDGNTTPVEKTLTLKADNISVKVGGTVTFTVTDGSAAVADPVIRIVGGEAIKGATWTATKAGEFKFVASKEGFKDSEVVNVKVEGGITSIVLVVLDPDNITEDTGMPFEVHDQDGNLVEDSSIVILGNPYKTVKGKLLLTGAPAGTYDVHATHLALKSPSVKVVVKPGVKLELNGEVSFGGKKEKVLSEYFGSFQVINQGGIDYALWITQTETASWTVEQQFITIVKLDSDGKIIDRGMSSGAVEAVTIRVFDQVSGKLLAAPAMDGKNVDISAEMKISYKVLGQGTTPAYNKVNISSSIIMEDSKNVTVTFSGDAKEVTWKTDALGVRGLGMKTAAPFLKAFGIGN